MALTMKCIHDPVLESDGKRILVDRNWPADISPDEAKMHAWYEDVAPTEELYKQFEADPNRFDDFKDKYIKELDGNTLVQAEIDQIVGLAKEGNLTLLHGKEDASLNATKVLRDYLSAKM
jgi:uncharacterized protein YeaO (DUF488 family)